MKLKKVLSIFLSVSMMLSIMPNVFAAGDDRLVDGTSKAKISCELFKYKEGFDDDNAENQTGSTTPLVEKMTALEDTTKDSEFFVGIKLSGITNIKAAVGDEGGLNSMFVKLNFNSEYIKPADTYLSDSYSRFAYLIGAKNTSAIFANKATTKYLLNDDASDITPNSVNISIKPKSVRYNGSDDQYIGMIKFKLAKDAPTVNVPNVLSFDDTDYNISFGEYGNAGSFEPSDDDDYLDIRTLFDLDTSAINIYANIAGASLESIKVKNAPYTIPNQFVGSALNTTGLQLTGHYGDNSDKDLTATDMANVKFYYGATGATSTTGLTAVPASQAEIKDIDNKVLYAEYKGKIVEIGKYVVKPVTITEITVNNNTIPTNIYDDTNINFNNLTVNVKKNNNDTATDLKFTNYENVSNGLAIYKSNAAGTVNAQVTAADKYAHGDNYFVVALKSDTTVKSAPFKVTSNYDDITISASTNNTAKTSYNKDDNFDPTGIVVKAKKASETTGADVAYDNFDSNYKVVIATSETEAKTATAVTASTKITEAMLDGNHKVYVVYTNAGSNTQSVVSVATLGAKKITGGSLTGGKTAYTYGDKFDTTVKFTPTYDDGSTGTEISFDKLSAAGITVKIGDTVVTADTVITPAMKDKTVDFVYDSSKAPVKSNPITVAKKTIKYSVSNTKITKVYDGNTDASISTPLPTITREALVGTDTCTLTGTFTFTDKNAGTNKDVKLTINERTLSDDIKAKYSFVPDGTTVLTNGVLAAKAEITKKALTLNAGVITGLSTKADPNATADVTKDGSLVLTTTNSNLVDDDNVTVPYTYTFAKDDVKTAGNDKNVTITLKDLTGADKDNYTFDKTQVTTAKGNVTQEAFSDIEISGPTKVTYTYPELTPDLSDLVVNAVYGTGTSAIKVPVTNYTLTKKDGTTFKPAEPLPYGDTEVTITYKGKTKTITLTAKKKPIKLSDIIFKPESKSYDGTTTATGTATVKEGVTVVGDTVNISAKWEFDGKDVGTNTIKVSDIKADNENYEIVGEDNLPVSSTTINNSTAVIKPATPENVTAKADKKTNNIVLSGTTADFEYSTDNGATWVKAAAGTTTIENAVRNKEYTILVRTAATTSAPASDAATVKATTYKYLVNIYKNGAAAGSEPEYKVYTNDEEINAVKDDTTFGKFNSNVLQYTPSRFRAYFTDSACTTSADVAHLPKDSNDNINLYYTAKKSSGGGGGGGSSVSIKLDKDTVSGVVGDKIKVTATVKGSTAKPTWTSSNEDVATVDENGNITLVGKGTATVKVKVNGIVKNIPVTVKEATATPVPTVKPTEAPVINTEYTKPYASGYDDGSFLPNNNITRGELAAMIARLSYGDDLPDGMYQASFPDVDSDAWFNKYIGYLEDKDVLSGYEDGTFRPMDTITRGEISAVIARAQRYDLISYNNIFTDVTENDWAKDYIETLADKNIVSGYEDGTFGPYSPLTRAEAVAIINRVLVESTPIVTFTPNDIAGHWAEADILLAVNERKVGANAVVPTVKPEETAAPEETVAPETTVTPEETVAPEKTTAPEATPAA